MIDAALRLWENSTWIILLLYCTCINSHQMADLASHREFLPAGPDTYDTIAVQVFHQRPSPLRTLHEGSLKMWQFPIEPIDVSVAAFDRSRDRVEQQGVSAVKPVAAAAAAAWWNNLDTRLDSSSCHVHASHGGLKLLISSLSHLHTHFRLSSVGPSNWGRCISLENKSCSVGVNWGRRCSAKHTRHRSSAASHHLAIHNTNEQLLAHPEAPQGARGRITRRTVPSSGDGGRYSTAVQIKEQEFWLI